MKQGWEIKQLGEVCEIYQPTTIAKKLMIPDGDYPVFGANGIIGKYDKYNHEESELLITCRGATCGSVNISLPKSWINGNAMVVRPLIDDLQKDYLEYLFRGGIDVTKVITGSAQPQITRQSLSPIEIPIPPHNEQKRIVAKLDECFEAIDKARANVEKNLKNAKELFQSKLNEIFSQKGDGWVEKKLGEVMKVERGGSPRPIKKYLTDDPNGLNWIKIGDATASDKYIYKTKEKITQDGLHKTRYVEEGDFILSNSMSFGKPYIMKTTGCIHDGWLVLKENDEFELEKDYLYHLLCSPNLFLKFDSLAAGSTVRNLNIGLVSSVIIPLPSLTEQKSIVKQLDKIKAQTQTLESKYQQELDALDEMKKSILQKAFSGEL